MKSDPMTINEPLKDKINLEMVLISKGDFMMGFDEVYVEPPVSRATLEAFYKKYKDELPVHKVTLKSFYMSKYPVTQSQYESVMGTNLSLSKRENNPVEYVSWCDAQEFCDRISKQTGKKYQLPSESQWEYACRAGSTTKYCFGDDENQLGKYAWYTENSNCQTHPVGEKKPNKWGLYDMHGNVWEWCEDDYRGDYKEAPIDGSAWESLNNNYNYAVLRGGSFDNATPDCRSSSRFYFKRNKINIHVGFRVVCVF